MENISQDAILKWIFEHRDDTSAMDEIQSLSFNYSTRGQQYKRKAY